MQRSCVDCRQDFIIHLDEEAFLKKLSFTFGSKTFNPPLPVACPDCRLQRRACHRNEQYFYKNVSAKSGKELVSLYAPQAPWGNPYTIYLQEEWRADDFDPLQYGRDFDFSRPFFEQFAELQKAVPRMALITIGNENSEYTTGAGYCKNCYMINSSEHAQDCYYGKLYQSSTNSVDCDYLYSSELCYQCFSVYDSYNCAYLAFSQNCQDCLFSSNLQSCKNCCLCTNLTHKEYHFMNQPLAKDEYERRVKEMNGSHTVFEHMKQMFDEQHRKKIHRYANIVNAEGCTGDYVENSSQCFDCYDVNESQDCRHVTVGVNVKDVYDCSNMYLKPELCYDTLGTIETYGSAWCLYTFYSQRLLFCDHCFNCSDCFACDGLTRKKFCIFNKQYTQQEYEQLVPKIIEQMIQNGEWGRYFPPQFACFAYNESLANEYFPLTREQAKAKGFHWRDRDEREYKPQSFTVQDKIADVPDAITQELLACARCGKNYKLVAQEVAFYRRGKYPVPRACAECRHVERMRLRNPRHLWERTCAKCSKKVQSTYAPDRPETVFCGECYQKEIY